MFVNCSIKYVGFFISEKLPFGYSSSVKIKARKCIGYKLITLPSFIGLTNKINFSETLNAVC